MCKYVNLTRELGGRACGNSCNTFRVLNFSLTIFSLCLDFIYPFIDLRNSPPPTPPLPPACVCYKRMTDQRRPLELRPKCQSCSRRKTVARLTPLTEIGGVGEAEGAVCDRWGGEGRVPLLVASVGRKLRRSRKFLCFWARREALARCLSLSQS